MCSLFYFYEDEIDLGWHDVYKYNVITNQKQKLLPPPPPPLEDDSIEYFLKLNPEIININYKIDLKKLENLNPQKKYFISINNELNFEEYIDLKKSIMNIKRSKGIEIRTEIN